MRTKHQHNIAILSLAVLIATGTTLPLAAEDYTLDPVHSHIGFAIGHLGISKVNGSFTNYSGQVTLKNNDPSTLSAEGTIQVASVTTGNAARDKHILGADFFDAETYPEIRFRSRTLKQTENGLMLVGKLTMHGTTKTITLPVAVNGPIDDPWGKQRIGIQATTTINRHDYGVGLEKGSDKLVGENVNIMIEIEAVATSEPKS